MDMKIKCDFCKKYNVFDENKVDDKGTQFIHCENCGRAITIKFKGEKYYEEVK